MQCCNLSLNLKNLQLSTIIARIWWLSFNRKPINFFRTLRKIVYTQENWCHICPCIKHPSTQLNKDFAAQSILMLIGAVGNARNKVATCNNEVKRFQFFTSRVHFVIFQLIDSQREKHGRLYRLFFASVACSMKNQPKGWLRCYCKAKNRRESEITKKDSLLETNPTFQAEVAIQ